MSNQTATTVNSKKQGFKKGRQTITGALLSIVAVNLIMPFILEVADPEVVETIDPNGYLDSYRIERVGYDFEDIEVTIQDVD